MPHFKASTVDSAIHHVFLIFIVVSVISSAGILLVVGTRLEIFGFVTATFIVMLFCVIHRPKPRLVKKSLPTRPQNDHR
jgi:hypothetical protein